MAVSKRENKINKNNKNITDSSGGGGEAYRIA
jgi:hypothetical protein